MDYTYSFICKCKSELYIEIFREIDFEPKCLKCNSSRLQLRYSIIQGELWMNEAILHEQGEVMGILDNLEFYLENEPEEKEIGYSTGKWSDDDDWNPITPFMGPNR